MRIEQFVIKWWFTRSCCQQALKICNVNCGSCSQNLSRLDLDLELDSCFALENSEFPSYAITIISLLGPWGIKIQNKTKKWKIDFHIKSEKEKKVETGNF